MWVQTHKAFLTSKQIERFMLLRATPVSYRNYLRGGRYCSLKDFIRKHKL